MHTYTCQLSREQSEVRDRGQGHHVARRRPCGRGLAADGVARAAQPAGTAPATRDRVLEAAAELSYIPSDSARPGDPQHPAGGGRLGGADQPVLPASWWSRPAAPVQAPASGPCWSRTPARTAATHERVGRRLADGSYDGVILTTTLRTSRLPRDLTERAVPHVLVNRVLDHPESPSCTVDNAAGAQAVSALVAGLGHRHVAAIHGPVATSTGRERALWLRAACATAVSRCRESCATRRFGHDAGMAAAHSLFDESPRPTAIVCGNDVIALGALSAARQRGLGCRTTSPSWASTTSRWRDGRLST